MQASLVGPLLDSLFVIDILHFYVQGTEPFYRTFVVMAHWFCLEGLEPDAVVDCDSLVLPSSAPRRYSHAPSVGGDSLVLPSSAPQR